MKKYVVYYTYDKVAEGDCIHDFSEFDEIAPAVRFFEGLKNTASKQILKLVTWNTEITDITDIALSPERKQTEVKE